MGEKKEKDRAVYLNMLTQNWISRFDSYTTISRDSHLSGQGKHLKFRASGTRHEGELISGPVLSVLSDIHTDVA
jgi:hypothetical protein